MDHITSYLRQSLSSFYEPGELNSLIQIICRDLLRISMTDIYLRKDMNLSDNQRSLLENVVCRLQKNEPIQYIRGTADFYRNSFLVAPGVLIPRPETEELVELILKENSGKISVLDIGTGSGCIAISLSCNLPEAYVEGWDVSDTALEIARRNNEAIGSVVEFRKKDVMSAFDVTSQFDVIVSNPPYITECEKEEMAPNVLEWEPEMALFVPNDDPLKFYRRIAVLGEELLLPGGRLYFEINQAYGKEVEEMLLTLGYREVRVHKDMCGKERMTAAIK